MPQPGNALDLWMVLELVLELVCVLERRAFPRRFWPKLLPGGCLPQALVGVRFEGRWDTKSVFQENSLQVATDRMLASSLADMTNLLSADHSTAKMRCMRLVW